MKFCIEFVGGNHPHSMRLMGEDPRTEQLIEEMELCFAGYSPSKDADVYAITPEQAADFISRYFEIAQPVQPQPAKRTLTPAQRAARQANARKATRVRMERQQHTNNIPIDRGVSEH